jgi:hypothetical protein
MDMRFIAQLRRALAAKKALRPTVTSLQAQGLSPEQIRGALAGLFVLELGMPRERAVFAARFVA